MLLLLAVALAMAAGAAPTTSTAPTTAAPTTTTALTTAAPTTAAPTTAAPTATDTSAPTTAAPTTVAPTTAAPTTAAPTTAAPTTTDTPAPTTASPTTAAPTTTDTPAPTTASPTTAAPTTTDTPAPTTASPTTAAPTTVPVTTAPVTTVPVTTAPATTAAPTTTRPPTTAQATTTAAATTAAATTVPVQPSVPCTFVSAPADQSKGRAYEWHFNLDFAKYDCDNLYQKFIQLWAVPSHTILLTATRQGSVIGSFFIADSTDGSSVAARFAALETALANPTSPESTFANSNGIPVLRATAVGGSGVPIGLVIGAAVGGIVLIVALILLIVFCVRRNKGRRSDTKYTPLLQMDSGGGGDHVIGAPFDVSHKGGDGTAMSNLVTHSEAKRRLAAGGSDPQAQAQLQPQPQPQARPAASESVLRFKLISDVRDQGEAVLTGARMGEAVEIASADWAKRGDWCWATVGTRHGWVPCNHLAPA